MAFLSSNILVQFCFLTLENLCELSLRFIMSTPKKINELYTEIPVNFLIYSRRCQRIFCGVDPQSQSLLEVVQPRPPFPQGHDPIFRPLIFLAIRDVDLSLLQVDVSFQSNDL